MPESLPTSQKMPLKVMAVDDNTANLKLITALLQERITHVVGCSHGQQAVDKAEEQKFDLIFMDIQMPLMDGVTASKIIKSSPLNHDTPVIAVTAHAITGEKDRLLREGMDDYLTKPIEEHVLQQVLVHWSPKYQSHPVSQLPIQQQHTPSSKELQGGPLSSSINDHMNGTQASETVQVHSSPPPVIDWQAALRQSANKADLAKDMLSMLVDTIPGVHEVIESTLAGETTPEALLHQVHKLHGSCAYSGVPRLKAICATTEQALRQQMQIEDIEPELFELQDEMEKVAQAYQTVIEEGETQDRGEA